MSGRNKLGIFVITYNRAPKLRNTLEFLVHSSLKDYFITVLDNGSTDDSALVAKTFESKLANLRVVTNRVNVGPNANFLKAIELSDFEYTWVLCDDDLIDLSHFDNVHRVIENEKLDLIHVGAHAQKEWRFGGQTKPVQTLVSEGYNFFKFASFMPCNIFRTSVFHRQYLIKAYNNIGNGYPHMAYAFGHYATDASLYISERQVMTAVIGEQGYDLKSWLFWWMKTCELLEDKKAVRLAFLDQWKEENEPDDRKAAGKFFYDMYPIYKRQPSLRRFVKDYFTEEDKRFFRVLQMKIHLGIKINPQSF
jgi:glycosyltransferase involved in cell wall biosynthesis